MLIWTFITAGIYLVTLRDFIADQGYKAAETALPDVDGALLVLMGVAQGGYIGGKLVSQSTGISKIERILPSQVSLGTDTSLAILGGRLATAPMAIECCMRILAGYSAQSRQSLLIGGVTG
jgi:hypothetical protein